MSSSPDGARAPRVAAIIVSHDGARWLPHLIDSLEASNEVPDRIIAVDTGSTDASRQLLADALGSRSIVDAPVDSGFGNAVRLGIERLDAGSASGSAEADDWLWLLHDDCAPADDALERLLAVVDADPSVSVVGCRIRAWPRARRLLEVGVTITGTGHRETGLELGEYDQGQHDGVRAVLAVSSAGMLVRRRVWDQLGGFDRRLPLFRDDVDFGWRVAKAGGRVVISPDAVLFHAEAATRGVRAIASTSSSPHRADRRAALFTLLANCSVWVLPFQYVRLVLGTLLRAVGYLVGKLPSAAFDEVAALLGVLLRPDRVIAARARRRRQSTAPHSAVRALLPAWWTPYANGLESVSSRFAETVRDTATNVASSARRLRSRRGGATHLDTESADDAVVSLPTGAGPLVWVLNHPVSNLGVMLAVVALVATRGLWGGAGLLQGGGLLPAPDGAAAWWRLYAESWHPVALGSTDAASPYVVTLAALGTMLLGKAWLAVDVVMLLCVPLAAIGAFAASRRLVRSLATQAWMTLSYAVLPVVTGAVTAGRIGTVVAVVLLPWFVVAVIPIFDLDRPATWRPVFAAAMVLAAIAAFAPLGWCLATALAVATVPWLVVQGASARVLRILIVIATPLILLAPWSLRLLGDPELVLTEAGVIDPLTSDFASTAWQLPFGRLAAAGDAPWWLTAAFLLAALVALLRSDRRQAIAACWLVIAASMAMVAALAGRVVSVPGSSEQGLVWVGLPVVVAQAAAIVAAGLAADGVTGFIQAGSFGWRQPLAAATAVLAVLSPLAALLWWVVVAPHGELDRVADDTLPAYIVDALQADSQQRVLVLTGTADEVDYDLVLDNGVRLGDDSVTPQFGSAELDDLIADVVSEGQPTDANRLAAFGIGYIMLPSPANPDLVTALDGLPGLTRASTDPHKVVGWQLTQPTGLVRVLDSDAASGSADAEVVPSRSGKASTSVPAGTSSRVVALAVPPEQGFWASSDGTELSPRPTSGTVEFALGADAGALNVEPPGHRAWWLVAEAILWAAALVLATPSAQRRQGIAEVDP